MASRGQRLGSAGEAVVPSGDMAAQVSWAPAIQTVTTVTTTTTTSAFPPFVMRAPRNLYERDPEVYPLASNPTPHSLKRLRLELGGQTAFFEEAEDSEQVLHDYNQKQAALQAQSGLIRTVTSSSNHQPRSRSTTGSQQFLASLQKDQHATGRRRSAIPSYPPPRSDGADNEFRRRRYGTVPARLSIPERRPSLEPAYDGLKERPQRAAPPISLSSNGQPCREVSDSALQIAGSATPPPAESDFELLDPAIPQQQAQPRPAVPLFRDTSPTQDASLPSPSLSPITAAAQLNRVPNATRLRAGSDHASILPPSPLPTNDECVRSPDDLLPKMEVEENVRSRAQNQQESNPPQPSFTDIPRILDSFDTLPESLKDYVMYQLLRRCSKPTLHFLADVISPALKCDFLTRLPLELSLNILKYLDAKSMCRSAQVSKRWRTIVNSDETAWKDLLVGDGFSVPDGEIQRAIEEGWGWQFPHGSEASEVNLGDLLNSRQYAASPSANGGDSTDDSFSTRLGQRRKRKAAGRGSVAKKQKRKIAPSAPAQLVPFMSSQEAAQGPYAFAQAAVRAVPNPNIGLPSLSGLHLFKSLYQRHYEMRQAWMSPETSPKHIAFRAHQRHVVTCLQFDSEKIITGSDDSNIDIYDTQTGASVRSLRGHEGGVWALEDEGNMLVSGSTDRSVRIWDISDGTNLHTFQGHTSTVRCLQIVRPVKIGETLNGMPVMMPKQSLIITGSRDSTCRVWKLPGPDSTSFFQSAPAANDFENPYFVRALTGHTHSVRAIAAYGDTLVSGSYDASVRVWKISTGELIHRLLGHTSKVYSVVLDYDRGRCISGSMDNLVKVWSLETGNLLFNLEGHTSLVGLLDLRDDCLVSAAADSTLRVWDPENGGCKHVLSAHTGAITCFSHDGQKVISGSDRTLKMWNTRTGECVRDLLTDLSGVWQIRFDERRCIAAVQRNDWTYIEVLDFGASRDGVPHYDRGRRIVVDSYGQEIDDDEWQLSTDAADAIQQ